jgi:protocatechuate 3,4-dioxygenase alpha subunit
VTLPRTPSQTVGPYFAIGLCRRQENELVPADEPGAVQLIGQLIDGEKMPVSDGVIEVWDAANHRWGRCGTDADGRFSFVIGKTHHVEVYVFARGLLKHQLTRVYFPDEAEANAGDPVLSSLDGDERATLVAEVVDGALRFDIRMQGARQTEFFAV